MFRSLFEHVFDSVMYSREPVRAQELSKVELAIIGSPAVVVCTVSVDVKQD